jgi:hypothetical protein
VEAPEAPEAPEDRGRSWFKGCDGTPFTPNEAVMRSCILRVGCLAWQYPNDSISRCISQNSQNTYEGTKCTLDAQTCADIAECEGLRLENTFCVGKAAGQYCNGNEIVECGGDFPHARDCTKYGGTCHDFGTPINDFGDTVDCALASVTTCAATNETEQCKDGYLYQCEGTTAYGIKCSNFAAACQVNGTDAGCYYPLNTCSTEGVTCTNDRATWCDGSTKAVFDCGSVGLDCSTLGDYSDDNGRQCSAPGCTPDDLLDCEESCDGSTLNFCYGGAKLSVDCKQYGFKSCGEYQYECGNQMGDCRFDGDTVYFANCE